MPIQLAPFDVLHDVPRSAGCRVTAQSAAGEVGAEVHGLGVARAGGRLARADHEGADERADDAHDRYRARVEHSAPAAMPAEAPMAKVARMEPM